MWVRLRLKPLYLRQQYHYHQHTGSVLGHLHFTRLGCCSPHTWPPAPHFGIHRYFCKPFASPHGSESLYKFRSCEFYFTLHRVVVCLIVSPVRKTSVLTLFSKQFLTISTNISENFLKIKNMVPSELTNCVVTGSVSSTGTATSVATAVRRPTELCGGHMCLSGRSAHLQARQPHSGCCTCSPPKAWRCDGSADTHTIISLRCAAQLHLNLSLHKWKCDFGCTFNLYRVLTDVSVTQGNGRGR